MEVVVASAISSSMLFLLLSSKAFSRYNVRYTLTLLIMAQSQMQENYIIFSGSHAR